MALDLNYKPVALVDTSTLTEDEWLAWRKKGIGGSDVAAALHMSPYKTAQELYFDKIGVEPTIPQPDRSITFSIGHLLEDVVAQIFSMKTGFGVYRDPMMYQHPLFPFMLADVDRFVTLPDGEKAILECKTAHYNMRYLWANGSVPRHYELQVRHYMSVMNIDVAFIACLFSNNEDDFVWQRIDRDLDDEENTIGLLESFWVNNVCARKEPPLVEKPDLVLETIAHFAAQADKSLPAMSLDACLAGELDQILKWKEEKLELDRRSRQLDGKIKSAYAPIVKLMGATCSASCDAGDGTQFLVSYNPNYREVISKNQLSQLRAQYPEIYRDFVDSKEYRTFEVKKTAC